MATIANLKIEGMHCDACVRRVRTALSGVDGVHVKDVRVGSADIEIDSEKVGTKEAVDAVNDIGFSAKVA
ncbi:MAG TPA: heavy-metal-associated domain-containing protein [Bryobacteraceae bacterium]|nr:heavy-metal-associated domain-containing protein [Bryobacteraceae bacterium]